MNAAPDVEALCARLESRAAAYPEDIFTPLSDAERAALPRGTIDRLSAEMGRFMAGMSLEAAAALREQAREIERLRREVASRNKRALEGDKASAAFNALYDTSEAHRVERDALQARVKWLEGQTPAPCGWPWDAPFHDGQTLMREELQPQIDALRAENERLRGYAQHDDECMMLAEYPAQKEPVGEWLATLRCTCGLDAAMAAGQYAMTDSIDSPQAPLK